MQSTGHAGMHLSQPLQSSGMITTSAPWLKIAPKFGGQARRQASQLMHSSISIRTGSLRHFGFRSRILMRSSRVIAVLSAAMDVIVKPSNETAATAGLREFRFQQRLAGHHHLHECVDELRLELGARS